MNSLSIFSKQIKNYGQRAEFIFVEVKMITFSGIHLFSNDPKQLIVFYRDILGWVVYGDDSCFDGVNFKGRYDYPVLTVWDANKHGKLNEGTAYFVFDCPNPDAVYQDLTKKGIVLDPPKMASWGGKELMVIDPDGNKLLMVE